MSAAHVETLKLQHRHIRLLSYRVQNLLWLKEVGHNESHVLTDIIHFICKPHYMSDVGRNWNSTVFDHEQGWMSAFWKHRWAVEWWFANSVETSFIANICIIWRKMPILQTKVIKEPRDIHNQMTNFRNVVWRVTLNRRSIEILSKKLSIINQITSNVFYFSPITLKQIQFISDHMQQKMNNQTSHWPRVYHMLRQTNRLDLFLWKPAEMQFNLELKLCQRGHDGRRNSELHLRPSAVKLWDSF